MTKFHAGSVFDFHADFLFVTEIIDYLIFSVRLKYVIRIITFTYTENILLFCLIIVTYIRHPSSVTNYNIGRYTHYESDLNRMDTFFERSSIDILNLSGLSKKMYFKNCITRFFVISKIINHYKSPI